MSEQSTSEITDEINRYVSTWVGVLTMMRGIPPEDAGQWVKPFLRGNLELTLHEPAAYWVAPALVPAEFVATLDPESLCHLHGDLQFALDQGDSFWDPRSDDELRSSHQRVLAVLSDYRARIRPDAMSDVFQTDLPKSEGFELGVRVFTRHWRGASVTDSVRGGGPGRDSRVAFGTASRLLIRDPEGEAHLWWDAFGLNVVVVATHRERGVSLLEAARCAFELNNYRGVPTKLRKVAA
jgi:hypothetical protein